MLCLVREVLLPATLGLPRRRRNDDGTSAVLTVAPTIEGDMSVDHAAPRRFLVAKSPDIATAGMPSIRRYLCFKDALCESLSIRDVVRDPCTYKAS